MCTYIREQRWCMYCRKDQRYRMLDKQQCKGYPLCSGYHRRSEYNLFVVCSKCLQRHPYEEYSDENYQYNDKDALRRCQIL